MSAELVAVRKRLAYDTPFWAGGVQKVNGKWRAPSPDVEYQGCATILNESKQPVKLKARPWQLDFDDRLEQQRAAGMPMRALILKARKLGFSTWVQAKFMQRVTQLKYQYALVAAQDRKTAGVLMDMARLVYDNLPTEEQLGLGFSIRPQIVGEGQTRSGSRWMSLGDKKRPSEASIYETLTAGTKAIGRGFTPSLFHGSEVAHWEDPAVLVGMLNAIPRVAETIAVLESTANGFNHFHKRWELACEGAEDPEVGGFYIPLFYGWQDNPENCIAFPNDAARGRFESSVGDPDGGGDDEELWLIENFDVSLEQLRWRRVVIREDCEGSVSLFHQEHPATPEQAFIGSGDPVFPGLLVSQAIKDAQESGPSVTGVLRAGETRERKTRSATIEVPQTALWVPSTDLTAADRGLWGASAHLEVWEHPVNEHTQADTKPEERKPDGQYVVFVDVAQGVSTTQDDDSDFSVIQVIDHLTRLQVAVYRSRVDLHDLPLLALLVATYYNQAWLAIEVTGLGIGVQDTIKADYHYPKLYRRRRPGDDQRQDQQEHLLGWTTTPRTKPLMEQTFGQMLKAREAGIRHVQTAREFSTYVEIAPGKHGAQPGAFDDLAMSWMGAHRVAAELRPRDPSKKPNRSVRGHKVRDELTGY